MEQKFPLLTSPIHLGEVSFRNRMFSAPMGAEDVTVDCGMGPRYAGFYELRAKGGAAAVTLSEVAVHPETDCSHMLHLELGQVGRLASFTYAADAIRRHGAVPSVEFSHAGQYAGTYMEGKALDKTLCRYGPSDGVREDGVEVRALTRSRLTDIVQAYADAAVLAKRAGFEMIMVHAGHGWLLNQFLSPWFNHRKDEYGGSLENRVRLTREVLTAVREAVGPGFPLELRMSGSELFDGGYDLAEGGRIAHALEDLVDLFHVSAGSYQYGFFHTHLPMFVPHGDNVKLAAGIKECVSKPVAAIGALNDPEMMEDILRRGKADVIYMGRALLADPFLPNKVMAGREDEIVHCLRCFTCMAERSATQTRRCAVDPLVGRELEGMEVTPVLRPKRVLVAGGGPGGLTAAITAAKRGHQVVLCEKTDSLGGILKCEQAVPFKHEMYRLGVTLARQAETLGVEVRLNTAVTPQYVAGQSPDALILAVGSLPVKPPLPGMDGENVTLVNDYYKAPQRVGDTVVVLGGGLAGCECAVHLAREGKTVRLVELRDTLAPDCNARHRPALMGQMKEGVEVYLAHTALEVTAEGLVCRAPDGSRVLIPGESVLCAAGQRANRADAEALAGCAPFVRSVGDCVRPANITKAVYEGYHAGLDV